MDIEKLPKTDMWQTRHSHKITYTPEEIAAIQEALKPKYDSDRHKLLRTIGACAVVENPDLAQVGSTDLGWGYAKALEDEGPLSADTAYEVGLGIDSGAYDVTKILRWTKQSPEVRRALLKALSRQESEGDAE